MAGKMQQTSAPIRLLLIDDEMEFVNLLAKRLEKRGFSAARAYSGKEGLRLLRRRDFEVVVLDLKMEDMDGMEVLKMIKVLAPDLPIIMLTGHGSQDAADQVLSAGAFDYLTKPYEFEALFEKIQTAAASARP
jgi:DNA-binding NtrC family response regulator